MKIFAHPHSLAQVLLAHALVLLLILTPSTQAGDILRMNAPAAGAAAVPGAAAADVAAINTAAATAQARTNAQDMLARNTMALQAVTAMQEAARAAAVGMNNLGANPNFPGQTLPGVPNGLGAGGLQIIGSPIGANTPQQSLENARTIVTIQQTQQQALLEWQTFNVGANTTLRFDQSAGGADVGTWIAFNRITDPTGNPTQILGSIEAQGQVYVINQNGIIFGGASVVNTHTLVASALPINENLIARGLLNNPDSEFLFSTSDLNAQAAVAVQAGARLTAPTSAANVGGRVALIGPKVTNRGTISTPDGQTILAAGLQVGFDAHSTDDPSLRGLDVYVGSVGTFGGTATNDGLIEAPRGSVVITGKTVNQNGFIHSTTSAALNGRVDLLANYNAIPNTNYNAADSSLGKPFVYQSGTSTGIVSTGVGSVIQILPEYASALKVVGTELALKSQINMQGLGVHLGMNSVVLAPNANVALSAGVWDLVLTSGITDLDFANSSGQIYVDQGAVINVTGSTAVAASITEYIITVDLRGAELADSALQRNGSLRGESVTVDLREHGTRDNGTTWVGTPLANLQGYLGVIERNVGQLTVAGGTVTMMSGEAVIVQTGAEINVSGGYQDFSGGLVETTRLLHEGNLVDIADARADIIYQGVYNPIFSATDTRWGTTSGSTTLFAAAGHYENAHTVGASGGALSIQAAAMALDGGFVGRTITGPQQLQAAPQYSSLELNFRAQQLSRVPLELPFYSPTPPGIEVRSGASGLPAANAFALNGGGAPVALRMERQTALVLSPTLLTTQGFGRLLVDNSDGNITVPAGITLAAPLAGEITLRGANVSIQGTLSAAAGTIDLSAHTISPYTTRLLEAQGVAAVIPPVNPARGRVTLGAAALLSTAGAVVDDRVDSTTRLLVPHEVLRDNADGSTSYLHTTSGGSISIDSYSAELAVGSILDVSGGFTIDQNGGITYADAGAVTLKAGRDPVLDSLLGGQLTLGATLRGFSGAGGGDLTLLAPMIQIGGVAPHADALVLLPEFFNQGGFDSFHLTGLGIDVTPPAGAEAFLPGVLITAGSVIQPQVRSLLATINPQGGVNSLSVGTLLKPEGYRPTVSFLFEAPGVTDFVSNDLVIRGAVVTAAGSRIETDALGSVSFKAQTVELLGSILAPGGTVSVTGATHYPQNSVPTTAFATVHLGAASRLSTAGKTVLLQDPYGRRTGTVHDGGTISVSGNLVAAAGAVLDVSGTTSVLDLLSLQAGTQNVFNAGLTMAALFPGTGVTQPVQQAQAVATQVDSHGGSITLRGGDFLFSNATLTGQAGGSTARGGSLTVQSNRFIPSGGNDDAKDITLRVAQNMSQFTQPVFTGGQVIGKALLNGGALPSIGYFGADSFTSGGFDALTLAGNVQFVGPVNVTAAAALKVADGGVLAANDLVRLTATYVVLGQALAQPTRDEELINPFLLVTPGTGIVPSVFSPTSGSGRLEVTADLLETGFLSLQNIGQTSLTARQELRGSGYLDVAGDLTITAGQIYPVTAATFTITAYNGTVTLASFGATPTLPLSGGGRLSIYANTIIQSGVLRAPLGTITLGWDGSGTAPKGLVTNANVPVTQQITLQNGGITSVSAIDPQTGAGVRIPYGIIKDGTNWIDPTGFDITGVGAPDKTVKINAQNVTTVAGSSIDIRGGGELYGYRWVEGNGGTNDILNTSGSYAILPGYRSAFAPFAPFATVGQNAGNLRGDSGYSNSTLSVGDRVLLQAAPGLAAGVYTLLPARYALLPGAMLVTLDTAGTLTTAQVKPGGAVLTSGYVFNSLNPAVSGRIYQQFEVAALSVVKARAEYTDYTANVFIPAAQQRLSLPTTFTASDAGYALLNALQTMQLNGSLMAGGFQTGRGGRVDVSSPVDIVLAAPGAPSQPGKLLLNTTLLSGWNAESLLIGGVRTFGTDSTSVIVRTGNLTLDNATAPLTGKEIILAATGTITLAGNAVLTQTGTQSVADSLSVSGNGALVRVSGVAAAQTARTGVTPSALPQLNIRAGAQLSGASITLDSSNATTLNPTATFSGQALNLNSGRVSIQLVNPGALQPNAGLVLGGTILSNLQASTALSLLSYSSIDLYGTGTLAAAGALALHAAEIRGFNQAGGTVGITAQSILLDNGANGTPVGSVTPLSGSLSLTAATITLGVNALQVSQYSTVNLNAAAGISVQSTGSFNALGDVNAVTPFFTAASNAAHSLTAGGVLTLSRPLGAPVLPTSVGLGAKLAFTGTTITADTDVLLPSGLISLNALTGNLSVSGRLDAGGTARSFFDQTRYTNAGQVTLSATLGNVTLNAGSVVNVAAAAAGGDAGQLIIKAGAGALNLNGTVLGQAGAGGLTGSADIDVGSLTSFAALNTALANGAFTNNVNLRLRSGSVTIDGTVNAQRFLLGVDQGSITVNGTINASGTTGGRINLIASGSVVVSSGALLSVAAQNFDSAGKGGAIWLEAGSSVSNTINTAAALDVRSGSTLNLSVAANTTTSAQRGQFTGTLHLRAPQTVAGNEVTAIQAIGGSILGASHIAVEGYKIYDLTGTGDITSTVQGNVNSNGVTFGGNSAAITTRLLTGNAAAATLSPLLVVMPGAEIVNRSGSLTLGTTTSATASDWNLATFRYGPKNAPGVLTLRAAGNLEFYNTLSDGFTVPGTGNAVERMWLATLTTLNTLTPVNAQSWSYRMAAGADFSAANFRQVVPLQNLGASTGSLLLGKDAGQAIPSSAGINSSPGDNALTRLAINPTNGTNASTASNRFQVIRTGTGDIEIITGRDVQLLNQFATIYTAGVSVPSATTVFAPGDFVRPLVTPSSSSTPNQGNLGAIQQLYPAQYSLAGGNVAVTAGADIVHLTRDALGTLIADSSRELPNNWLMRRGYVDATGQYGNINVSGGGLQRVNDAAASTTWWVNFSNFFDGVAALGGGNVTLKAGRDVQNVSAHAPTNARAARGTPSAAALLELGGGDVTVIAGRNIDGGIYYVERGSGSLQAGGQITTNATRSPSLGLLGATASINPADTWLPTTLFVGKSSFAVSARSDVLLGPVANTFLLPQGVNNKHWYKTYFSTYGENSGVAVTSLGGSITFRQAATQPFSGTPESILGLWMKNELLLTSGSAANYQPWLRLAETNVDPFFTLATLMPGSLRAVAYSGDINLVGRMNLSPSASGTINLLAAGAVNGLRPTGLSTSIIPGGQTNVWSSTTLNLSDANPAAIPGVLSPYAYYQVYYDPTVSNNNNAARNTGSTFLNVIDATFAESGSTTGTYASTQVKQQLHAAALLHLNDTNPVRIYAGGGDLSGLTLFSGKPAVILAQRDITDIALYVQNLRQSDVSIVSSGRDIVAYNANSILRSLAVSTGNLTALGEEPKSGDIQINGPGTLQVLAGRNLNLGTGSNNADGTGVGITSIGNGRNPNLSFAGAGIVIGAGMGAAAVGLGGTNLDFTGFITEFASGLGGNRYLTELAEILGVPSVDLNDPLLTPEQQRQLALAVFYLVLRDAGRDHNDPDSPNAGTYTAGFAAIAKLFPTTSTGSIETQARDIRTRSGGDISILAPAGRLQLASTLIGSTLAPPGVITEAGGSVSIFTHETVDIGIARIFTLRGGDITIWSSAGDIAAGSSSKTVQSAPPTRVLIDPQSANVATDLAGLATGGGIGVLATVAGVRPGNVDLIAPIGAVDAGDAGIRATGNLNIAATIVLNSANISVGGTSAGTPAAATVASPSLGTVAGANNSAGAATSATAQTGAQNQTQAATTQALPSIITVEVIGYGGGSDDDEERKRKRNQPGE